MEQFFTEAFKNLSVEEKESFYRTVILSDPAEYAGDLRVKYYAEKMKKMGEGVKIGANVKIVNPQYISLGDNVVINDNVTLIARGEGGITIDDGASLQDRVYLDTERQDGYIHVGKKVYIGTGTTMFGHAGLEIGDHTLLAQNITVTPYSHIFDDPEATIISQGGCVEKVTIGRDCYLGMGVCVMYSGSIGDGSVVGAHSTVIKAIPPYSVAVGTPARVIKKREKAEQ